MSDTQTGRLAPDDRSWDDAARLVRLEDENLQLRQAVSSHAVIDQAIGVVLAVGELTPEEGWNVLRQTSQRTNVKLRRVAEAVVEWARTGEMPEALKAELERAIQLGRARTRAAERLS
ncbi:ANTAR domain-containing protein [Streptomyces sp. NPDC054842]